MSTKVGQRGAKVNRLLQKWPSGLVGTYDWLKRQGISRQLASVYRRHGWLESIGHGAYRRAGDEIRWPGAVFALQREPDRTVHPGGKTALDLLGYAHFVSASEHSPLWLLGRPGERLPAWFLNAPWAKQVHYATAALFADDHSALGLTEREVDGFRLRLSRPERAMIELLHFVPQEQSFEEARLLMEGLLTLRPSLVQELLEACGFIKVRRLFLALAEAAGHPWFSRIDTKRIDLGSGKRVIVPGGRLHPRYQITVPAGFLPDSSPSA